MDRQEIEDKIVSILVEEFELDKSQITTESHLYEELGLDSIDAVDLVAKLQEFVGKKIDPETFRNVRTIHDVIVAVVKILNKS